MRYSPLTQAALKLTLSTIDRVWPAQIADAWDSKPPAVLGAIERPTHMLITSWAIDQLKAEFPELDTYRNDIIDGANATELHELPLKTADRKIGEKYGLDLEAKRVEHRGTNAGTDDIVGWWNDALAALSAGEKARGYFIVGIMLHMIEDMGVPSHARGIYHQAPSPGEPFQFDNFEMMGLSNWKPSFDSIDQTDPEYSEPWRYYKLSQDWTNRDTPKNFTRDGFSKTWRFASEADRKLLSNRQGHTCHVVMWTLRGVSRAVQQVEAARVRVGPTGGGAGGNPFTDLVAPTGAQTQILQATSVAKSLTISTGSRLDSVQLTLSTGALPAHGGSGGTSQTLHLEPGEYIESTNIWVDNYAGGQRVFAIRFVTSKSKVLEGGSKTGAMTTLQQFGYQLVGFFGRSGSNIDQLGVIMGRASSPGVLVDETQS